MHKSHCHKKKYFRAVDVEPVYHASTFFLFVTAYAAFPDVFSSNRQLHIYDYFHRCFHIIKCASFEKKKKTIASFVVGEIKIVNILEILEFFFLIYQR